MINCTKDFQTVFTLVLLYLQAVFDELTAVLDIEAASLYFVLFVADSLHNFVRYVLNIAVRLVIYCSVNSSAVVVTEDDDKPRAEVFSCVLDTAELV